MAGMGLSDFLGSNPGGGGRRGNFLSWKDSGSVVIWLHTQAKIGYAYTHQFMVEDEYEDRETGKMKAVLRFPRFVSTEPLQVLQEQYFRDKTTDRMKLMPNHDPFLLLREWLRVQVRAGTIAPDTVVFEWFDPKNNQIIRWHAGDLSGLEKRSKLHWNHSIDAKLQYVMCVVDDANPGAGILIAQETQAIGDKLREEIRRQMDSRGDDAGNPTVEPYAFKWKFDKNTKNPNDVYSVFRYDKAVCTDEIWNLIANTEAPDTSRLTTPQEGDAEKIRAAFERAARIDLPLDLIFSPDAADRRAAAEGAGSGSANPSRAPARGAGSPAIPAGTGGARRPAAQGPRTAGGGNPPGRPSAGQDGPRTGQERGQAAPRAAAPAPASPGPQTRRRRVEDPKPPPPPVEDEIPCEDCGVMMSPTATDCPGCGAQYDVEPDAGAPPPRPVTPGPRRPPSTTHADVAQDATGTDFAPCWSCGSIDINFATSRCNACGMSQNEPSSDEDIPF